MDLRNFFVVLLCGSGVLYHPVRGFAALPAERAQHSILLPLKGGTLSLNACGESVLHVVFAPSAETPEPAVPVALARCAFDQAEVHVEGAETILSTSSLRVTVSNASGRIRFLDRKGGVVLDEPVDGGRRLQPTSVAGRATYQPQQLFVAAAGEAYYGLGQRQEGFMNWRDIPVRLQQVDSQIAIPVVLSNKGFGILWNNAARTDFNPTDREIKLDPKSGQAVFTSDEEGVYGFLAAGGTGREDIALKVGGKTVAHLNGYLVPYAVSGKMKLSAHTRYTIAMTGGSEQASVFIKGPSESNLTGFRSEVGNAIDYYFFYGPDLNRVVAQYRTITGAAPLFPRWAYGFLQCRERYSSQAQLLEAAQGFRTRHIPIDAIIQDWQYWGKYGWNAMRFDENNYPDASGMIRTLHDENLHFLISVWSKFDRGTPIYEEMKSSSLLVPGTEWFDAFHPAARELYWSHMKEGLFRKGVDGWWLDATEPEFDVLKGNTTYLGPGEFVRNSYPFYVTRAVYEGQRAANPDQRVFILTRAAYAGQQRYAAASWSGDIGAGWEDFRLQIPAGLNFTASGIPYWTTDVGGFGRPDDQHQSPAYHEILTRWFEYGVFCPLFRIHGNNSETEIWKYGPQVEADFRKYDELRYRMQPYIYSSAWMVTHDGGNLMRALPLDYHDDPAVAEIGDQFLFGPSMLINPVTKAGATSRRVYLPKETAWIDFWTGNRFAGGRAIDVDAPLDKIPVFVKPGAIIPMGPSEEFVGQHSGPIELRVYPGADGDFTIYDDDGASYNYEKGEYATIPIHWNQSAKVLSIGPRHGGFPKMPESQEFSVVWVRPGHGTGVNGEAAPDSEPDARFIFRGEAVTVAPPAVGGLEGSAKP